MHASRRIVDSGLARLAPIALAGLAVVLLAPTCGAGGGGLKAFSKGSIVIPMDACYQGDPGQAPPAGCPSVGSVAQDNGNVIRAYGLVYQLIRANVPVYWVIAQGKTSLIGEDFRIQYNAGLPVTKYDWAAGGKGNAMPPNANGHVVSYIGGPFVVDGSDFAAASAVMQGLKATFSSVNAHVSGVAFQANVAKSMSGGWDAGGNVPPPIALLDIHGPDKNSEGVIQGYLDRAGLGNADFPGAGGTTAPGQHGKIYDRLQVPDFLPDYSTSALGLNGYQVLWIPHWYGPGSWDPDSAHPITQARLDQVLSSIGGFVAAKHDAFAECASIGTLEGAFGGSSFGGFGTGNTGPTPSRVQTPSGVWVNEASLNATPLFGGGPSSFALPYLQLGGFNFSPLSGAIEGFRPNDGTAYQQGVVRLITDANPAAGKSAPNDYFTYRPATESHGTIVYLSGHTYSGTEGSFQIAGSRLVLNTLFNLGSACAATGTACSTGAFGECAAGTMQCDAVTGQPRCVPLHTPQPETCDGRDNDCNGIVDDLPAKACYDGPAGTKDVGVCHGGTSTCTSGAWTACLGEVVPTPEICDGLDNDCNGHVDDQVAPPNGQAACYSGPPSSLDPSGHPQGSCRAGTWTCSAASWSCQGEVLPRFEICEPSGSDENCNGVVDENCSCVPGQSQACYGGPSGTSGVGECRQGTHTCDPTGRWSACVGQVVPAPEACDGKDNDCNGSIDDGNVCDACKAGQTLPCYTGPAGTKGVGTCADGVHACVGGQWAAACTGSLLPGVELCDGKDNDCNGKVDDGAACPAKQACVNGACTFPTCGVESPCRDGYACQAGQCVAAPCGSGAVCATGMICRAGACVDPCAGVHCGAGSACSGGACVAGGCYATPCAAGQLCVNGACTADACANVSCAAGTFCRAGDCVQSCAFMGCAVGERCGMDGFCVADRCAGVSCGPGEVCTGGACGTDPCSGVRCAERQTCLDGACADDPCAGVTCPVGQCLRGQCFSSKNPDGAGSVVKAQADAKGCGCGTGGSAPTALLLVLALLPFSRRRRTAAAAVPAHPRRGGRGGGALLLLLALAAGFGGSACSAEKHPAAPDGGCTSTCGGNCIDLAFDARNCGACGASCGSGEACVDSKCGPASAVAPFIAKVDPSPVAAGTAPDLALGGDRFAVGATLRVVGPSGVTELPAQFADAKHLSVPMDLTNVAPGTLTLRLLNPGRVVSNAYDLAVVVPTPHIDALAPTSAVAGTKVPLHVTGGGFMPGSTCIARVPSRTDPTAFVETGLPTTLSAGALDCAFDLALVAPGDCQVVIQNPGLVRSAPATFSVASATPSLAADGLSPSSGRPGEILRLRINGSGFDAGSVIRVNGVALSTTFVAPTQLYADMAVDGRFPTDASYPVVVVNAAATSNDVPFTVNAGAPSALSLTAAPTQPVFGTTVQLHLTGGGFDASCRLQVQSPGSGFAAINGATALTGSSDLSGPHALTAGTFGTWNARASCTSGCAPAAPPCFTSAFPFQVLTNVAVLSGLSPAGGVQGGSVTLSVTGSNVQTGAKLHLLGPNTDRDLTTTVTNGNTLTAPLSLVGLDAGTYAVTAVNPGAAPSNGVGFAVTPGQPSISGVTPGSLAQGGTQIVTLTGTNFAAGVTGSTVHAQSAAIQGGLEFVLPQAIVNVPNATTLQIALDTTTIVPATYTVWVVNPGSPSPQVSNKDKTFTLSP